jgi:internalin A
LSTLTDLDTLRLDYNELTSLQGVDALPSLQSLSFGSNTISELSPLSSLSGLKRLEFPWTSSVTDIDALIDNDSLRYVDFSGCSVGSLYPVQSWPQLDTLLARSNSFTDIYNTLNSGLGDGDLLDVRFNSLDSMSINNYIPELQSRGVTVDY